MSLDYRHSVTHDVATCDRVTGVIFFDDSRDAWDGYDELWGSSEMEEAIGKLWREDEAPGEL